MKKIIPFAVLMIAFLMIKCSNKKTYPDNKNEINNKTKQQFLNIPESGEDTLKVSYFADTVSYIPFETTKESFIQYIDQLWMNDSVIIINNMGGGLLMFRQNGKFLRKIGKNGRGPGEYGSILHFDVIRDTIYISCTGRRGLLRYTFDGTFCDEIKFNYQPAYFSSTADQKLACYIHGAGKIFVYNKNIYTSPDTINVEYGVTLGRYRYIEMLRAGYNYLQKTTSGLLFNSFLSDTVWNISEDKKEPAFILNMKNQLLPYDKQIEFSNGDFEKFQKLASPYTIVHLLPFTSLIFIFQLHHTIMGSDTGYDGIYLLNPKSGEIKKFNTTFIYDDIVSKQKLSYERLTYFYPICLEDYLVTTKKPLDVLRDLDQEKDNSKELNSLPWFKQMKAIKEDDNPILVKIKLKKNMQ